MQCLKCGFDSPSANEYCPSCGARLDLSSVDQLKALARQKKQEKERYLMTTACRLLLGAVAVLVVLWSAQAMFRVRAAEPVSVAISPPHTAIVEPQKLSLEVTELPVPEANALGKLVSEGSEEQVLKKLIEQALRQAPLYVYNGKRFHAFILNEYGDTTTIYTLEGKQVVPTNHLKKVD